MEERRILDSWKEIAAYLGRSVKTCRRWEHELGLPIHRLEDSPKARVFAYPDELDQWIKSTQKSDESQKRIIPGKKKLFIPVLALTLGIIAIAIWQMLPNKVKVSIPSDKPCLAILPAKNNTGDPGLDIWKENIQHLLITDMIQSKHLHVLDFSRVYSVLTETDLLETKNYTEKDLKNLAEEATATHIIQLFMTKAGENYQLSATIKDTRTMNAITAEEVSAIGEGSFFDMVDSLTQKVKSHFNLTEEQIANDFDEVIATVTTENPKALQYYVEAHKACNRHAPEQAVALLEQAVAIDPDFAMAHWMLSRVYFLMSKLGLSDFKYILPKFKEARQKAYDAMQRRPVLEKERLLLEAFREQQGVGDHRILEKLVELYPEDIHGNAYLAQFYLTQEEYEKGAKHHEILVRDNVASAINYVQLSKAYFHLGLYEKSGEIIERGLEKFPDAWVLNNVLLELYIAEGKYDEALAKWEDFFLSHPTGWYQWRIRGQILLFQEDFAAAEEEYQKLLTREPEDAIWSGMVYLISLYILQGRFDDAFEQIEMAKKRWGEEDQILNSFSYIMHMRWGDLNKALEAANFSRTEWVGSVYAKLNMWEKTEKAIKILRKKVGSKEERLGFAAKEDRRYYLNLLGSVEFEKGNLALAIEYFEQAKSLFIGIQNRNYVPFVDSLAFAYYEAGNLERAKEEYELITTLTWGRIHDGDLYARSFYMLGKIYEELGEKGEAKANYERFLDLWKDADSGIAEVEDAKKRLAGLKSQ
jgi:tetratricopeptide (TPR) repeat protein